MVSRIQSSLAVMSLLMLNSIYAADRYVAFVTPMQCGEITAQISLNCIKSKDPTALNDCKMPQKMTFLSDASQNLKSIQIPSIQPNEIAIFKKGGTDQSMFAHTWSCIKQGKDAYLLISYSDPEMGKNPYSEYLEIYRATGEKMLAKDQIQQILGIKDKSATRSSFVNSIFPE